MAFSKSIKIFSGSASVALTEGICHTVEAPRGRASVSKFSDGEIKVQIGENIRGSDVFIVNSTCPPVNDNLMELLILIDAARRASADRVTAV
ncbi:MAG: ribose-phosphate pyrophosphokinase, partial [Candidatus Hydrogenedentes bacterium]|nr:ribose-phosphate pyrophosphokinase [Candidatus Hydrogenedentota bacterium]